MGLCWYYRNNAGSIVEAVNRVQFAGDQRGTDGMVMHAVEGSVGRARIMVDDPDGTFDVRAHRKVYARETDAEADDYAGVVGVWYTADREVVEDSPFDGVGRVWSVDLDDINTVLDRRIMLGSDAVRPRESDYDRVQWLLSTGELNLIDDDTYVSAEAPVMLDAADLNKMRVRDILHEAAQDSGKNWYVLNLKSAPDEAGDTNLFSLWYGHGTLDTFKSDVLISNDPADTTAHRPAAGTRLKRTGARVYSRIIVDYDGDYVVVTRAETATDFALGGRDTTMQAPTVKTAAKARSRGARYLETLNSEEDTITTAIVVTSANVNSVVAGHYVRIKLTHLGDLGYSDYVWMRVVNRTVRPLGLGTYELSLELIGDAPAGPATCTNLTPAGNYYPLGGSGSTPNASDGVTYYLRPGIAWPVEPTVGHVGSLHFPIYGAGGSGTYDEMGTCVQNRVRTIVTGDGTLTLNTNTNGVTVVNMSVTVKHKVGIVETIDEVQTGVSGDSFVVNISSHNGVNCTHYIDVRDTGPCGTGWRWLGSAWAV